LACRCSAARKVQTKEAEVKAIVDVIAAYDGEALAARQRPERAGREGLNAGRKV
jgi:hypothetical protein